MKSPPAAAPDTDAGIVRIPAEAGGHRMPVRPTLDATPADLARFAAEVLVEAGIREWALAVFHEGRPVERRFSAGVDGPGQTVSGTTMFNLESVAKPVVAWGVMNLVEAGRMDLDQPIERYLSRWRLPPSEFDHREVTVRRVLSHTSGLSWGRRQQFAAEEVLPPIEEVLSGTDGEGRRLEVIVQPGTRFIYSSGGYTLLQLLVEEVSGRPFAEFMKAEVLRPLGMHHSVFSPALPEAPVTRTMDALGRVAETDRVATSSSLITSLEDLTAFALAHLEGEGGVPGGVGVLRPATLDSMLTPVPAARNRRGLGYSVRRLDGDLLVAGHSGGGGDFRVVPQTGDGLVILTNSTVGYFPIERILCVWTGWLTGTKERCPVPSSYALLGAYRHGGVPAALDYYDDLVDRADPDYLVGIEQLSDFARLFVGAGMDGDAAAVYRYMARSGAPEGTIYGEVSDRLLLGQGVPEDRLPCYLGEYRSSSGDTIQLERTDSGVTVTIDPVVGIGGPVRMLTDRVFLFDFGGFIGELVFDLAESGAATSVTVRESTFGILLTAERSAADATGAAGCVVMESPPQAAEEVRARTNDFLAALSDDSPTFVSPFYAPDAVLVLPGGVVLEGREAIVRGFLRPRVPALRGVRALSEELVGGGDTVTWKGAIAARIAPAADTVRGALSATWARLPDGEWRIAASTVDLPDPDGEAERDPVRSGFFQSAGTRLHYLDFGGAGVPLVFMPNRDRTAYTFIDFAPRFTDRNRVLAVTSRGTGESGGEWDGAPDIAALGRDVIALLDSLGLERAVVAHAWAEVLVYLAEQHPGRMAGLVFLAGMPQPALPALWDADTTGTLEMVPRLAASWDGADPDEAMRLLRERWYVAQHLRVDRAIDIPALVFLNEGEASSEGDRWETDLQYARWVADGELAVPDSATRAYFLRLASDDAAQAEVRAVYRDLVAPAHHAANERFRRAFGDHLRLISL
ncbi:MAG TPA: serine hydrolase, partial [Gemmatimonadota bacterium]|nr:serine hydrolase [Gemmatimonadota bacterium]